MKNKHLSKLFVVFALIFVAIISTANVEAQNMFRKINDFDGDGKADYAITRNENGLKVWYVRQSTTGFAAVQWGLSSDSNVAGDYDGDGKTDFAVSRLEVQSNPFALFHRYYILKSGGGVGFKSFNRFNQVDTRPMPQDYDGDGKTDFASWISEFGLSSNIQIILSSTNSNASLFVPARQIVLRIGDLDGDRKADRALQAFDAPYNVTLSELNGTNLRTFHFGTITDLYVPADFDGDTIGDLTVWRRMDGNWWWLRSSDNTVSVANWGTDGDTPVPADYDGDGKTDLAIFRNGVYWIRGSQNGVSVVNWGIAGDVPVQY